MTPRFEFRAFAPNFGIAERNLSADAELVGHDERRELYLVSAGAEGHNVKVRGGDIDVKRLLRREGELELWTPDRRASFPLDADEVLEAVAAPLGINRDVSDGERYSLASVLSEVVFPAPDVVAAVVVKQRRSFRLGPNDVLRAEHARVTVNGAGVETLAVECENPELLTASVGMLGLDVYRNTNYVAAIKTITGLTPFYAPGRAVSIEQAWAKSAWEKR